VAQHPHPGEVARKCAPTVWMASDPQARAE
jgi:hypothetical protein